MAGNVWGWVNDWYDGDYYDSQTSWNNPTGPVDGTAKVMRGGSWNNNWWGLRTGYRYSSPPELVDGVWGIRCAASIALQHRVYLPGVFR